jgi:prophage antirepressor-like protein
MKNSIQNVFNYGSKPVRITMRDGEPWFVAKDVCDVLEIANSRSSLSLLEDDEKDVHNMDTPGGNQEMTIINEPGLYSLVLKSRKPEAKKFKRWVTHDVLPTIRKTGSYNASDALVISKLNPNLQVVAQLLKVVDDTTKRMDNIESTVTGTESSVKELQDTIKDHGMIVPSNWRQEVRSKVDQMVVLLGRRTPSNYRKVWHNLYDEIRNTTGVDIRGLLKIDVDYNENNNIKDDKKKLDIIESNPIVRIAATKILDNMLHNMKHKKK